MDRISKTKDYLLNLFNESQYLRDNPYEREYRYDHTLRVAYWGKYIAEKEGLDVDALVVGCLLHDASYCEEMITREMQLNHGRRSAKIVESFLKTLEFDEKTEKDILYGISIHVDNQADFKWESTLLAESISDADNIDRFDVYRIYESLQFDKFSLLSNEDKIKYCEKRIDRINKNFEVNFSTNTATELFHQRLKTMLSFFDLMLQQCQRTV